MTSVRQVGHLLKDFYEAKVNRMQGGKFKRFRGPMAGKAGVEAAEAGGGKGAGMVRGEAGSWEGGMKGLGREGRSEEVLECI